jgi:hypothetical protein
MRFRAMSAAVIAAAAFAAPAKADPQVLGLLATAAPVPMNCAGAVCLATVSAFCLEKSQSTPSSGTLYSPAHPGRVTVSVTEADGRTRTVAVDGAVTFVSQRGALAVRVVVDRRRLGLDENARVTLAVGADASLIADGTSSRDATRQLQVTTAIGAHRALGSRLVDGAGKDAAAARGLAVMMNGGAVADTSPAGAIRAACAAEVARREHMLRTTIGLYGFTSNGRIDARFTVETCLEQAHDRLMLKLNERYWNAAESIY